MNIVFLQSALDPVVTVSRVGRDLLVLPVPQRPKTTLGPAAD